MLYMLCGSAITGKIFKERVSALINLHENHVCEKLWVGISKDGKRPEIPFEF